jgi:hypothetical protein
MLTNGRSYKDPTFTAKVAAVKHPQFISAIPLYADIAGIHDYIVQAAGAFDETVEGLYNAAEAGLVIEIRIVLHKQSIPRLVQLAEYIYHNFPLRGSHRTHGHGAHGLREEELGCALGRPNRVHADT